nr:hypothetical protein [Moraxella osloensis]
MKSAKYYNVIDDDAVFKKFKIEIHQAKRFLLYRKAARKALNLLELAIQSSPI